MEKDGIKIKIKKVRFFFFFCFFKNCELIKDSSLWHSNFTPSVCDLVIIIRSRSVTDTFDLRFNYKCWVRVSIKIWILAFLGKYYNIICWVSKRIDWGSHHSVLEQGSKISFTISLSFVSFYHSILFLLCSLFFVLILWHAPSSKKKQKQKQKTKC